MYKRIIVPVDGSVTSTLGVNEAVALAADQKARLRLLNVVDEMVLAPAADAYPMAGMDDMIQSMRDAGRKALDEAERAAAKRRVNVETAQVRSRARAVSDVILADARRWRADLIVMGTHGRRGMNRLLLGSDAERVLRESRVPVLLVRGERRKAAGARKGTRAGTRRRAGGGRARSAR